MKICTLCGKKIPQNQRCSCVNVFSRHKQYNTTRRDKAKNDFYHSREWRALTVLIKSRAKGLDEYALSLGAIVQGNTVHHIYPIDERPELKLSVENLIYVSAKMHNQIHAEYERGETAKSDLQAKLIAAISKTALPNQHF